MSVESRSEYLDRSAAEHGATCRFLSIGHGGWTMDFPPRKTPSGSSTSRLSHYGDSWREHIREFARDAVAVDLTAVPWDELCKLSVSGPMCDPYLPDGTVQHMFGESAPWQSAAQPERDPRFGDARSLDYVALDVYLTIARSFGARIFSPHDR